MTALDLLSFSSCNLDPLTETYNITFYLEYLARWPNLCYVIESHAREIEGYSQFPARSNSSPPCTAPRTRLLPPSQD